MILNAESISFYRTLLAERSPGYVEHALRSEILMRACSTYPGLLSER